jgi:hypothetical protein
MNGFHDDSRMEREQDARDRGEIRAEQDARWGDGARPMTFGEAITFYGFTEAVRMLKSRLVQ